MRNPVLSRLAALLQPVYVWRTLPFAVLLVLLQSFQLFKTPDDALWDVWTRLSKHSHTSQVVIVAIDESTLARYGRIGGWDRDLYARALEQLQLAGAQTIGLDVLFPERTRQEDRFLQAVRNPKVVLADAEIFGERVIRHPDLRNAQYGAILLNTSFNNVARTFQTQYHFASDDQRYPSFAAQLARVAGWQPVLMDTPQYIRYLAAPGQAFNQISFADVVAGNFAYRDVQDRIVVIGVTAGGLERDQVLSPYTDGWMGSPLPVAGVEVQAQAISTLLAGGFVSPHPVVLGTIGAFILLLLAGSQVRARVVVLLTTLLVLSQGILHHEGVVLPISALLVGVVGGLLLRMMFAFTDVQKGINEQLKRFSTQFQTSGGVSLNPLKRLQLLREVEEQLSQERKRLQILLDNVDSPMFLAAPDGTITLQNPSAQKLLGDHPRLSDLQEHFELPDLLEGIQKVLRAEGPYEALSENGLVTLRPLGGEGLVGMVTPTNHFTHLLEQHDQQAAAIVHDLKSPLTSIMGFAQFMDSDATQEQQELLGIMLSEARRMADLIDDFLMLSRSKAAILDVREVDLAALVRRAAAVAAPLFTEKHITLQLDLPRTTFMEIDDRAMTRVLLNLLSNAVKYSPMSSEVTVHLQAQDDTVRLSVRDHGVGLSEEDKQRLFGRFFRSSNPAIQEVKGTGLGLYTVKELVKAHGGEIWVDSTLGQGSTFTLSLPVNDPVPMLELV